jgi:PAS domain S-box-containing protein
MLRAVWANEAGLAVFGCQTLFDLIDRPFGASEPGVETLSKLGPTLKRGQAQKVELNFPSAGQAAPIAAFCHVHTLPDGRPGLLVAGIAKNQPTGVAADVLAQAFQVLPGASFIIAKDGRVLFANEAASRLLGAHAGTAARELADRLALAGTVSEVRRIETPLGQRDFRLTLKLLPQVGESYAVVQAEDVTERRRLERGLALVRLPEASTPMATPAANADEAFAKLGEVLRGQMPGPKRARRSINLPPPIRKTLDSLPGANLLLQAEALDYANAEAAKMLGYGDAEELMASDSVAQAVAELNPGQQAVSLQMADGILQFFDVKCELVPWRSGPARKITILRKVEADQAAEEHVSLATADLPTELPTSILASAVETVTSTVAAAATAMAMEPVVADAELRAILDTATDGIITLDTEGRIKTFSAGAEAIFGFRSAEVRDKPLADLLTTESRRTLREYLSALLGPGLASVFNDGREVMAVVKQGGEVPLFLTIGKLQKTKPGQAALCAVVRDITQWKKTEAELRAARDEAENASRLKSEFLANVSHELRTPLNAIIGFSEMMRLESFGEIENEKYRSYVNDIHASGAHLLSLINDLLDLSKVEAGKLELNFTSVGINEVVDHAMRLVQEAATQARVILRKTIPPDLPNVVADLRSMRQIVLNILTNAIKFTDPGGQVIVSAMLTDRGELRLRVSDTGIGMSEEQLKIALEPFRRLATEGREVQGTGLGLPLTKALAEANRALFEISSETGKGTTVAITFPTTRVLAS